MAAVTLLIAGALSCWESSSVMKSVSSALFCFKPEKHQGRFTDEAFINVVGPSAETPWSFQSRIL
jgi:hypothetical protein